MRRLPHVDHAALEVLGDALLERLGDERELVASVRRVGVALHGAGLHDRLGELDHGVAHLDLDLAVEDAQVVQHTVQVQLACADQRVLAALLNARGEQRVGLVHLAQPLEHARQLARVQRLHGHLEHALGEVGERAQRVRLLRGQRRVAERGALHDRRVHAGEQGPAPGRHPVRLDHVAGLAHVHVLHLGERHVLLVLGRVRLAEHLDPLPRRHGAAQHAAERTEGAGVRGRVQLGHLHEQRPGGVAALRGSAHGRRRRRARVACELGWRRSRGARHVLHQHVDQADRGPKELAEHQLEQRAHVELERGVRQADPQPGERAPQRAGVLREHLRVELVHGLEDELHKAARRVRVRRAACKVARLALIVHVAPEPLRKCVHVQAGRPLGVHAGKAAQREAPPGLRAGERHVAPLGAQPQRRVAAAARANHAVHLLERVPDLEVGLVRRETQLQHEAVQLVEHQHDRHLLAHAVPDERLGLAHDALHHVHHQHHAVHEAERGADLVGKVRVARRVERVHQEALLARVRQHKRHGRRLDREPALPLQHVRVRVAQPLVGVERELVRLFNEHVHQARLAVVQVAHDRHVPHHLGELHQLHHERAVKPRVRQPLLLHGKAPHLFRLHNRLAQRLCVLLLHERLDVLAVHLRRGRIVHLVLVQHHGVRRRLLLLVHAHHRARRLAAVRAGVRRTRRRRRRRLRHVGRLGPALRQRPDIVPAAGQPRLCAAPRTTRRSRPCHGRRTGLAAKWRRRQRRSRDPLPWPCARRRRGRAQEPLSPWRRGATEAGGPLGRPRGPRRPPAWMLRGARCTLRCLH